MHGSAFYFLRNEVLNANDWNNNLNLARDHMETRPYIAIFPGLAISYAVLAFNLCGDGLRDILDPRLAER